MEAVEAERPSEQQNANVQSSSEYSTTETKDTPANSQAPSEDPTNASGDPQTSSQTGPLFNTVCPSVRKGEPCWALSKGKPCHYAVHNEQAAVDPQGKNCNVYVCHLPLSTNKEQLEAMFAPYGQISECKLLVDPKTQEPKGVGFVHFAKAEEAKNAIDSIDGLLLTGHDKPLECRLAKPNPKAGTLLPGMEEDWQCSDPTCAYVNWARRSRCNKCGRPKGEGGRQGRGRGRYDDYPRRGYDDRFGPPRRPSYDEYDDYRGRAPPYGRPRSPYGRPPSPGYGGPPPAFGRGGYGPPRAGARYAPPPPPTPTGGLGLPIVQRDPYLEGPSSY